MRRSSPVTATGSRRIHTGFPQNEDAPHPRPAPLPHAPCTREREHPPPSVVSIGLAQRRRRRNAPSLRPASWPSSPRWGAQTHRTPRPFIHRVRACGRAASFEPRVGPWRDDSPSDRARERLGLSPRRRQPLVRIESMRDRRSPSGERQMCAPAGDASGRARPHRRSAATVCAGLDPEATERLGFELGLPDARLEGAG